jgi:hypothetical protein
LALSARHGGVHVKALTSKASDSNRVHFKNEHATSSRVRERIKQLRLGLRGFAMNKDNEYRENAAECERMARLTRDKTDKSTWLDMARHWRGLISVPPGGGQQPGD